MMNPLIILLEVFKNVILFFSLATIFIMIAIAINLIFEEVDDFKNREKKEKVQNKNQPKHSATKIGSHRKGWNQEIREFVENSKNKFAVMN